MSKVNGVVLKNMIYNGTAVKKWNHNGVQIFSAGSTVTYVCAGKYYTEEVDSGASVLSPKTFSPTLSGATFKGWSKSPSSTTVETSLTMGSDPMVLYAVFKYDDKSWSLSMSNASPEETRITTISVDTSLYSSAYLSVWGEGFGYDQNGSHVQLSWVSENWGIIDGTRNTIVGNGTMKLFNTLADNSLGCTLTYTGKTVVG